MVSIPSSTSKKFNSASDQMFSDTLLQTSILSDCPENNNLGKSIVISLSSFLKGEIYAEGGVHRKSKFATEIENPWEKNL